MATYKDTDKIISHLNDEIEACGNPDIENEPIAYGTTLGLLSAKSFIETAEIADTQEVRRARWIKAECSEKDGDATCSACGHWDWSDCNYCSNCGAKMDGKE